MTGVSKRKPKLPTGGAKKSEPNPADDYLRRLKGLKGVEDDEFSFFDEDVIPVITEFLPTGSLAIDKIVKGSQGGWPIGGISELSGWSGAGKSCILDQSIASCQRQGGVAVLVDTERARDKRWTKKLGVDLSKLIVFGADTIEDSFTGIERALEVQQAVITDCAKKKQKAPPMLIVWDSLGATPTKAELEGAPDDKHMAVAAKVIKMNLRRVVQRLPQLRAALVFSNQFYSKIGGYGAAYDAYGGTGPQYYSAVRIWLTTPERIKLSDNTEYGHVIRAKAKKNRISGYLLPEDFAFVKGAGIDNAYTLFEWGLNAKNAAGAPWISKTGNWYYVDGAGFQRQFMGLGEVLGAQPEIYQAMAAQYLSENDEAAAPTA